MTASEQSAVDLTAIPAGQGVDEAVAAARRVIASLLYTGDGTAAEMQRVTGKLNEVADYLDKHAPDRNERMVDMWSGEGTTQHDPVTGPENAVAPPLQLAGRPDGSVVGVTTLGIVYQGPPGHVHGGISALLLDHALGVANHWGGLSGMTAELTLRYHRPTPLFEPLTVTGRQDSVDGRKIRSSGQITAGGKLCVSAEGLFIAKHLPLPR